MRRFRKQNSDPENNQELKWSIVRVNGASVGNSSWSRIGRPKFSLEALKEGKSIDIVLQVKQDNIGCSP